MNFLLNPATWKLSSIAVCFLALISFANLLQAQNTRPTLDRIPDYATRFSPDLHYIELNGISAGDEIDQELSIEVSTGDKDLIDDIAADLVDNGKAYINYRFKEGTAGTATIKVVITDNGSTPASVTRSFRITCESLNRHLPAKSVLLQASARHLKAFPNPALSSTRISFSTPHDEQSVAVDLYSLSGTKVRQLFFGGTQASASYYVDVDSRSLPGGVYFVRLSGNAPIANLKLVVAK
jgi:hypothetical protein